MNNLLMVDEHSIEQYVLLAKLFNVLNIQNGTFRIMTNNCPYPKNTEHDPLYKLHSVKIFLTTLINRL